MADFGAYPAVTTFKIIETGRRLTGYAAPRSGRWPSVLKLVADNEPVAFIRAGQYSPDAMTDGFRFGWCGFEVAGLAEAFALGSKVELRCAATDHVLLDVNFNADVLQTAAPGTAEATPTQILEIARAGQDCTDIETIKPFVQRHRQVHGLHSTIDAAYRSLLQRGADSVALTSWSLENESDDDLIEMMEEITVSAEFIDRPRKYIPGPFHPSFGFDLSIFG